jgi:ribosomal protein S18 acetylase RimI-like enzyme
MANFVVRLAVDTDVPAIAVSPSRQSGGNGRRLIAAAEEEARSLRLGEIRVVTNVTMAKGIRLYRSLGYEEYERTGQDGYYRVFLRKLVG